MKHITHSGNFFDQLSYHVWKPCEYLHQACRGAPLQVYKWEGNGQFTQVEQNKKIENLALRIIKFVAALMIALPAFLTFHVFKLLALEDDDLVEKYHLLDRYLRFEKQTHLVKIPQTATAEGPILQLPQELKFHVLSFLDIPDLARLKGVNREFQHLMQKDQPLVVRNYQENMQGLQLSENNSSMSALIDLIKQHAVKYRLKPELVYFFGSLKRILEYPVITPDPQYKNIYSWIKAQSIEDWKQKPNILRVQGQHFDTHNVTESIVMKYSMFLPKEVQRAAEAVDRIWHGYLYTQSEAGYTSTFFISDLDIQKDIFENLLNKYFKKMDATLKNPLDLTASIFCITLPRLFFVYRNYKNQWDEVRKARRRFQDFIEGKSVAFYENLSEVFRETYPYVNKVVVVLGWKNLQEITSV